MKLVQRLLNCSSVRLMCFMEKDNEDSSVEDTAMRGDTEIVVEDDNLSAAARDVIVDVDGEIVTAGARPRCSDLLLVGSKEQPGNCR